jgi:hypothetical protein
MTTRRALSERLDQLRSELAASASLLGRRSRDASSS